MSAARRRRRKAAREVRSFRSFIIVRAAGRVVHIETTNCFWCNDKGVCSACHAKANKARESLAG